MLDVYTRSIVRRQVTEKMEEKDVEQKIQETGGSSKPTRLGSQTVAERCIVRELQLQQKLEQRTTAELEGRVVLT